jgi:hypothetical protein
MPKSLSLRVLCRGFVWWCCSGLWPIKKAHSKTPGDKLLGMYLRRGMELVKGIPSSTETLAALAGVPCTYNTLPTSLQLHALAIKGPILPTLHTLYSKAQSLQDILDQLRLIISVSFELFQPEQPRQLARALLPLLFLQKPRLFDYFTLFFTHDLFQTITTNTNRYASIQKLYI